LGLSITTYCFDGNGKFSATIVNDAMMLTDHGTYTVRTNQLEIKNSIGKFAYRIVRSAENEMTLHGGGDDRTYMRVARRCNANRFGPIGTDQAGLAEQAEVAAVQQPRSSELQVRYGELHGFADRQNQQGMTFIGRRYAVRPMNAPTAISERKRSVRW
jgi:hypothetical protein